jgi:ribosomal protein S18 acetylase RimI-like enzyme
MALIRRPAASEAAAIAALVDEAYAPWVPRIGRKPFPMIDDYPARIAAGQAWVVGEPGALLGILILEDNPDGFLLDNIATSNAARGKGIGRMLMQFAESQARAAGHTSIILYTNALMTENIALYERIGYAITRRVVEKEFSRVYMAKALQRHV